MLRTIRLYGELGKRFGRVHRFAVSSPREAVSALIANFPAIRAFFANSDQRGIVYRCSADKTDIDDTELDIPLSRSFTIAPVVRGGSGVVKFIVGAALAVVGVVTGQTWLIYLGASLALGGVSQLLAPHPKNDTAAKVENLYFDGPINTSAQGEPVPFGYGEMIVGSKVVSAAITIEDQSYSGGYNATIGGYNGGDGVRGAYAIA